MGAIAAEQGGDVIAFNYATMPAQAAAEARQCAVRIRTRSKGVVEAIVESGADLLSIKDQLPHGAFGDWLRAECDMSERTARNFMAAARAFKGKTATVADLTPTTLYMLAAVSPDARGAIISRIDGPSLERPADELVKDALWEVRQAAKRAREDAKLSPTQRKAQERRRAAQRALQATQAQRMEREAAQRAEAMGKVVRTLVERFGRASDDLATMLDQAAVYNLGRALRKTLHPDDRQFQ